MRWLLITAGFKTLSWSPSAWALFVASGAVRGYLLGEDFTPETYHVKQYK